MNYEELKEYCLKKIKKFPNLKQRLGQELYRAKIAYENGIDLVEDLIYNKDKIKNGVIPFLLGLIKSVDLSIPIELKQARAGGAGGIDVDIDYTNAGKPLIKEYLENRYGKECVISVGTYSEIGLLSGLKDILRKEKIDFQKSNEFCKCFDDTISWEQNIEKLKDNKSMYNLYLEHKDSIDMCPKIIKKFRQVGVHAGGV
ncbi:MAG: hypothetical protein LBF97_03650, partial [Elusimicrobiota bacterium]|nr:hypothetical protein [Elusimicrobiota bacterium]